MLVALIVACTPSEIDTGAAPLFETPVAGSLTVSALEPASLPADGGAFCVVGAGFDELGEDMGVSVDGEACLDMEVQGDEHIACRTGPHEPGEASVRVAKTDLSEVFRSLTFAQVGGAPVTVDACAVVDPCFLRGAAGEPMPASQTISVRAWEAGLTTVTAQEPEGMVVEVGWGHNGSQPSWGCWQWSPASWVDTTDGYSVFHGGFQFPPAPGNYDFAARVSLDEGRSWLYCDLGPGRQGTACRSGDAGSYNGYDPADAGELVVDP